MSIRVICPGCKKGITAGDSLAGKKAKCPGCGTVIMIPGAFKVDEFLASTPPPPPPRAEPLPPPRAEPREEPKHELITVPEYIDCPFCSEQIKATARKCRHCGEYLDQDLRAEKMRASSYHQINVTTAAPQALPQHVSPKPSPGIAALLSFIIPGAGQMYRNKVGQGILWFVAVVIGYAMLIVPGLVLHIICIIAAATDDS